MKFIEEKQVFLSRLFLLVNIFCFANAILYCQTQETKPGPRWGHVLIYYPPLDQLLLFGGAEKRQVFLNDTWLYKNEKWIKLDIEGPGSRGFAGATYHEEIKTIILHGGRGNENITYSDTWEWDGEKWQKLQDSSQFVADHHSIVYLPKENKILGFGGWTGKEVSGTTWMWNEIWEEKYIEGPPPRAAFSMTYDKHKHQVIVFGGLWINGQYADRWKWEKSKWQQIGGHYDNSSLDHHSMIYDENLKKSIIFGGKNYRYDLQDNTLEVGNKIMNLDIEGPLARHSFGFTYDSNHQIGVLFGGKKYEGDNQVPLGDFWQWKDGKWFEID